MAEHPKRAARNRLRPVWQIVKDLKSPNFVRRERAIGECSHHASASSAILAGLVRGLNDSDPGVRDLAFKGLVLAFPGAAPLLSQLMSKIDSAQQEVPLATRKRVLIILAQALAGEAGLGITDWPPTDEPVDPVKEDLMEHAGRWVAWTRDRQRILAVSDSFADVMEQATAAGETDPYVRKAPGVAPQAKRQPVAVMEDESSDIIDDIRDLFPDPDAWLNAPNASLGGAKPRDLIGSERERELRDLLRGIKDGITT